MPLSMLWHNDSLKLNIGKIFQFTLYLNRENITKSG